MFGFAFHNIHYSDWMLRLIFSEDEDEDEDEEEEKDDEEEEDTIETTGRAGKKQRISEASTSLAPQLCTNQGTQVLYVCAALIAKDSSFFRTMFGGHRFTDSSNKIIDILLKRTEREAFLDLLKYLYTMELQASTVQQLLLVWQLSQRFLVDSCVDLCIQRLLSLEFSWHDSGPILEHANVVEKTEDTERLTEKSILALASHFGRKNKKHNKKHKTELQHMSSQVIELLASSDCLPYVYEKEVYKLLHEWIHAKYQGRQSVDDAWAKFQHLIRWPFINIGYLKKIIRQPEWNRVKKDSLIEALLYHASMEEEKAVMKSTSLHKNMYHMRLNSPIIIKSLSANISTNQEVVFFSITVDDWQRMQKLEPNKYITTQTFYLCGTKFEWKFKFSGETPKMRLWRSAEQPMIVDVYFWIWNATKNAYIREWEVLNKPVASMQRYPFHKTYICGNGATWCKSLIHVRR